MDFYTNELLKAMEDSTLKEMRDEINTELKRRNDIRAKAFWKLRDSHKKGKK